MASWTTSWFGTNNKAVFFRYIITENYSTSTGKRLRLQLQVKKTTAASLESRAPGYMTWYLNGTSQGKMYLKTLILPANNSVQTVSTAEKYITLADSATSATIKGNFEMPKATVGENNTGSKAVTLTKYTVNFNANGGSGSYSAVTGAYRNVINLNSYKPTRKGYTLLGWSTSSTATSASYTSTYNILGNTTLYAVWRANTYTITYNANGGTGAPAAHSYTYNTSGSTNLSNTIPTRTNYTFLGWSLSSTATSATYRPGQAWGLSNASNYTLYAVWVQSGFIHTIMARRQQPNGQFSSYEQVYMGALEKGDTVYWSSPENEEYKKAEVSYIAGETEKTTYIDILRRSYHIFYNANGGVCVPDAQKFLYNADVFLSKKRPARSGYKFLGWSFSPNANAPEFYQEQRFDSTNTFNPTLYAVWQKRNSNILLKSDGSIKLCEFVESNYIKFSKNGNFYAKEFIEDKTNNSIKIGEKIYATNFSEWLYETINLIDESENKLTDENGNHLIIEVEV